MRLLQDTLKLCFMAGAIEATCAMLARVAATLANGGVNPLTGHRVFDAGVVKNALSVMGSCGACWTSTGLGPEMSALEGGEGRSSRRRFRQP